MSSLCIHFGTCGGCVTQDLPDARYREVKRDMVVRALARHGVEAEVRDIVEVPPGTRRRCVFKIARGEVGFHARATHQIVDLRACRVLTPGLVAFAARLRAIASDIEPAEAHVTEADNGMDVMLRWRRKPSASLIAKLAVWAGRSGVARIAAGNDVLVEFAVPMWGAVRLPPGAFLQPTRAGEEFLQGAVAETLRDAKRIADLFAGCGTFALALARQAKVHAVEFERAMLNALEAGARATPGLKPVTVEKRDLFKRPLIVRELDGFDAVVLDPPRAGAEAQAAELAKSRVRRIAYVSCDPESFARDARLLVDAGLRIAPVVPVDQFLWSEHIELVTSFER